MKRILHHMARLWVTDVALTTLLVSLVIYVFILHPLARLASVKLLVLVFFSLILISGATTASRNRIFRSVVLSWSLLTFTFLWAAHLFPNAVLVLADLCLSLVFLVLLNVLILSQVFREGPTTSHRIMGAIAAYLLLGLIWSLIFQAIALQIPNAFKGLEPFAGSDPDVLRMRFQYFSFTVLTTVGFGDIVPVDPIAQMAAVLEATTGQLFVVILIARLVTLQINAAQSQARKGD